MHTIYGFILCISTSIAAAAIEFLFSKNTQHTHTHTPHPPSVRRCVLRGEERGRLPFAWRLLCLLNICEADQSFSYRDVLFVKGIQFSTRRVTHHITYTYIFVECYRSLAVGPLASIHCNSNQIYIFNSERTVNNPLMFDCFCDSWVNGWRLTSRTIRALTVSDAIDEVLSCHVAQIMFHSMPGIDNFFLFIFACLFASCRHGGGCGRVEIS